MPIEPPPTRLTPALLAALPEYQFTDGWLMKDRTRYGLRVDFTTGTWTLATTGDRRITKPTFTALCNSSVGPNGGFIENAQTEEQFLETFDLSPEHRWNLIAVPIDKAAFVDRAVNTAKQIRKH